MIISLNWLKQYVDIKVPTAELVALIGSRLVEVESVTDIGEKYRGIMVVEVRKCQKIEGSDHLSQCVIWDGQKEHQVVCGAPNVRVGLLAVWLPPGVTLPATWNEEPLVIEKRQIMGVESNGMLASMRELGLGDEHDGIVSINPADAKAGDDFAAVFELNDTLLDIENKSLTHRPDCFGIIGFAREVAGILGQPFIEPEWFRAAPKPDVVKNTTSEIAPEDKVELAVEIADAALCLRYEAVVMTLPVKATKTPKYLDKVSTLLARSGMRPIDPIVDMTNFLMLLTGQPLHAFDYNKLVKVGGLKTAKIIVRAAKVGEKLELLDGKTVELDEGDIVITSNNVPVALAGAMGGANTAIDKNTRRIVIESATFNLYNLRGTQFRHGIFSEAITRFTKGQPPALTDPVIRKYQAMTEKHFGLKTISDIVDAYPKPPKSTVVKILAEKISDTLGANLDFDEMVGTLENVGFKVKLESAGLLRRYAPRNDSEKMTRNDSEKMTRNDSEKMTRNDAVGGTDDGAGILKITVPWWRMDIHVPEDVIEEVGRLNGYDNIPTQLPRRGFRAPAPDQLGDLKAKIRLVLAAAGANEVLTYSFVSQKLLENAGQDPNNSYRITNSISPQLQYTRQSLTPSLLDKVFQNQDDGFEEFALFEINKLTQKKWGLTDENVPVEKDKVALAVVGGQSSYYRAKNYADKLFSELGITARYLPLEKDNASDVPFSNKQRAKIEEVSTGLCLGVVGSYKAKVRQAFDLPANTAGFELIIDNILAVAPEKVTNYQVTSRYPEAKRDLTFRVVADLEYAKLADLLCQNLRQRDLWFQLLPVSIYQGDDQATKNISFNLRFASYQKTLSGAEIADIIDGIASEVKQKLKGEIV